MTQESESPATRNGLGGSAYIRDCDTRSADQDGPRSVIEHGTLQSVLPQLHQREQE